ncbi:MAG: UDP-N-acetylglucosamine 1-carboxyvinyltransferase [Bdellovibrionales bacterium]
MDKFVIQGGKALNGTVIVGGAKNSSLPLLFATLLADGEHVFHNVPRLKDIESTCQLLESLGCKTSFEKNTLRVTVQKASSTEAHYDLVRKMRASILCLGPLLTRYGEAVVSLPGGCAIGTRPIDLHLNGMQALGATINLDHGYVHAKAKRLKGADVEFPFVTVGGTENILMAAVLAEGKTTIHNAAQEPEIVDLANYLNKMGARIKNAGESTITVEGVESLKPAEHDVIPDRIEAATLLIAGAITGGALTVNKCIPEHFHSLTEAMRESGIKIDVEKNSVHVHPTKSFRGVDIKTDPYPGFATDIQAQFMALMCRCEGTSTVTETIFENRFMHVQELVRLGAQIFQKGQIAIVTGTQNLKGAPVMATDLRASASLVLAGLVAEGETHVNRIYHLDRGYEALEEKLKSVGANIRRMKE